MQELTTTQNELAEAQAAIVEAGAVADQIAAKYVFDDYTKRKASNTLRAQLADLATYSEYLQLVTPGVDSPTAEQLMTDPVTWTGCSWGLVEGFVKWMLGEGYAVTTVNHKLSTVKTYAKLANKAGVIDVNALAMIKNVTGYSQKERKRIDEGRSTTRKSVKKAEHTTISREQAKALKTHPDTPQGRRDAFLMCLLLDHGLRCGEVALLTVKDFDVKAGTFAFFRPKVDKVQTHRMTADTLRAACAWLYSVHRPADKEAPLLRGSRKGGKLTEAGMSERAITKRVRALGEAIGLDTLSAHDCRHYWATTAANNGTSAFALRDAGGWASIAMPARYVEAAEIANEGVSLGN